VIVDQVKFMVGLMSLLYGEVWTWDEDYELVRKNLNKKGKM
jgi:hypothetical protein